MKALMEASKGQPTVLGNSSCRGRNGFNLIELMVVVAIIAIMAALMLPVISKAKQQATAAKCLNNQKQLANAFLMYTTDNTERIVQMADYVTGDDIYPAGGFWGGPVPLPQWNGAAAALAAVQQGLETSNAYYFYCNTPNIYHCPGDPRIQNTPTSSGPNGWAFDSYSRTQNLGGDPSFNYWGAGATYTKITAIPMPSLTFSMTENTDWRGYSVGTWLVDWVGNSFLWEDPVPMWHINMDSVSFADGHVELHRWTDPQLIAAGQSASHGWSSPGIWNGPGSGADYQYIFNGYQFPGHP